MERVSKSVERQIAFVTCHCGGLSPRRSREILGQKDITYGSLSSLYVQSLPSLYYKMDLKSVATSENALLAYKEGLLTLTVTTGLLDVYLTQNGEVCFNIGGSSFELLLKTKIHFQTSKDYKRVYHFLSDPITAKIILLKVNDNYELIDKIFKEAAELIPYSTTTMSSLKSSSFRSIKKSEFSKTPSIKFTQSQTIGGSTIIQNQFSSLLDSDNKDVKDVQSAKFQQKTVTPITDPQCRLVSGTKTLGDGITRVGDAVGCATGNLLGGVFGALNGVGQGVYNGIRNGVKRENS